MKILIGIHHLPPHYKGGAEWRAFRTARALQERGHTVQLLSVERVDFGLAEGATYLDDTFSGLSIRRLYFNLRLAPDPFVWEYDNTWVGKQTQVLLDQFQPDIFHLMSGYLLTARPLWVAREAGVPAVISLTDFWFLCRRITMLNSQGQLSQLPVDPAACARCWGEEQRRYRWLGRLLPRIMKAYWRRQTKVIDKFAHRTEYLQRSLQQAALIISPSQFLKQMYLQAGLGPERIIFMRQGLELPAQTPGCKAKTAAAELRLGYIGQIAPHKGVHVLFDAVSRLPGLPIRVKAYGDLIRFPRYVAQLQRQAEADPRLELAGNFDRQQDLARVMRDLDVIVMPSLWYENSPNNLLEAFFFATPAIVSNLGGMAELVQDSQNGLVFTAGDAADLALKLRRLLAEPDLLPRLRSGIGPVVTQEAEMDQLLKPYHQILEQAQPKRRPSSVTSEGR